jgi:hypothetical protein
LGISSKYRGFGVLFNLLVAICKITVVIALETAEIAQFPTSAKATDLGS